MQPVSLNQQNRYNDEQIDSPPATIRPDLIECWPSRTRSVKGHDQSSPLGPTYVCRLKVEFFEGRASSVSRRYTRHCRAEVSGD